MKTISLITSLVAVATLATAQTPPVPPDSGQVLRGAFSYSTDHQAYVLNCTDIRLFSHSVPLSDWADTDVVMKVDYFGARRNALQVNWVERADKTLEIGDLALGQSDSWRVFGPEGSFVMAFADFAGHVQYTPVLTESYLLGPNAPTIAAGFADSLGVFKFEYYVPNMPAFIGAKIVGQAGVLPALQPLFLTNADCSVITA